MSVESFVKYQLRKMEELGLSEDQVEYMMRQCVF